jgi:inosine/xanthosine triphosphate pyrophosphatase family protein
MPHDFSDLKLVSSNPRKLEEIRSFGIDGLEIETGRDLMEIEGAPDEVIVYKALEAGVNRIVEDSVMYVDDEVLVDARWRLGDVENWSGRRARWESRFGVYRGDRIEVYLGAVDGVYVPKRCDGREYDSYFLVPEEDRTLAELFLEGRRDAFSARRRAADNMLAGSHHIITNVDDVPQWGGSYQHT